MTRYHILVPALLLPVSLALTGCGNLSVFEPQPDKTKFFILENETRPLGSTDQSSDGVAVQVGPSSVAKYLDQSQIVTFVGTNELDYSDLNRWGEPLVESVNRVLISHIARGLNTTRVGFMREMGDFSWQYRVGYHIYQLGGQLGGTVHMMVGWWITSREGETTRFDGAAYEQPVNGGDYSAYIQAIEDMIDKWADDVTRALKNSENQPKANSISTSGSEPTSR